MLIILSEIISGLSMIMDLKFGKVFNLWIIANLGISSVLIFIMYGWTYLIKSLLSFIIIVTISFVLYFIGAIGAGDCKLFGVLGQLLGVSITIKIIIYSFIIAAIIAIFLLVSTKSLIYKIKNILTKIYNSIALKIPYKKDIINIKSDNAIHFTVPIFLSTVLLSGGVI